MRGDLDQMLAFHCGPALTGLKASNLVSVARDAFPDLRAVLERYNHAFNPQGVYFRIVCECGRNTLLLVYRSHLLTRHLAQPLVRELLVQDGYPVGGETEELLEFLSARLRDCAGFPHEIGLFLGYPPEDVEGFMRNRGKNCKLCGYWKVYSDVETAKSRFRQYDQCRETLCRLVSRGMTLLQLFQAA